MNDATKIYQHYEPNDDFELTKEDIPEYNRLVDQLNNDLEQRDKLVKAHNSEDYFVSEEYKTLFKAHSLVYEKYMDMQEKGIALKYKRNTMDNGELTNPSFEER